jgi:pimeloyl-ACP methyl ester carboxylesterase
LLDNELDAGARRLRDEFRSGDRVAADAAYKGMTEKALDLYLGPRWGTGWREQVTAARLGAIRRHAGALSGLLPAIDGYSVAKSELAEIVTPTLVVIGEDAAPVDRLVAERLVRALPNGIAEETTFGPRGGSPFTGAFAESANDLITHFIQRLAH